MNTFEPRSREEERREELRRQERKHPVDLDWERSTGGCMGCYRVGLCEQHRRKLGL